MSSPSFSEAGDGEWSEETIATSPTGTPGNHASRAPRTIRSWRVMLLAREADDVDRASQPAVAQRPDRLDGREHGRPTPS